MKEKKMKLEITLTEREIEILERYGEKSEVISDLIVTYVGIPDDLKTEEEKRDEAPYVMYYDQGELLLKVRHKKTIEQAYNDDEFTEGITMTNTWLVYTYDDEGNGLFEYLAGGQEYYGGADLVFKHFGEEINNFAQTLKLGQVIRNGVLIEDGVMGDES